MFLSRGTVEALVDNAPSSKQATSDKTLFVLAPLQGSQRGRLVRPNLKCLASAIGYGVEYTHSVLIDAINDLIQQGLVRASCVDRDGARFEITEAGLAAAPQYAPCAMNEEYMVLIKALIWNSFPDKRNDGDEDTVDPENAILPDDDGLTFSLNNLMEQGIVHVHSLKSDGDALFQLTQAGLALAAERRRVHPRDDENDENSDDGENRDNNSENGRRVFRRVN